MPEMEADSMVAGFAALFAESLWVSVDVVFELRYLELAGNPEASLNKGGKAVEKI